MVIERSPGCANCVTNYFSQEWSNMYIPDGWQTSEAFQLDKQNGKQGTKVIRLISKLCPLGKAFFTLTLQDTVEKPTNSGMYSTKNTGGNKLSLSITQ